MAVRIIVEIQDTQAAAGVGADAEKSFRTFVTDWPELEAALTQTEVHKAAWVVGAEVERRASGGETPTPKPETKPPEPETKPEADVCECGHGRDKHTAAGCLVLAPEGGERKYCRCTEYVQAGTLTAPAPEPEPEPVAKRAPEPTPRTWREGDCESSKKDGNCPWAWAHDGDNGVPCNEVNGGQPCGMIDL